MSDIDVKPETNAKPKTKQPPLHKVILLNDDYTPREFVVVVLRTVFHTTEDQAYGIMLTAHQRGACVVAVADRRRVVDDTRRAITEHHGRSLMEHEAAIELAGKLFLPLEHEVEVLNDLLFDEVVEARIPLEGGRLELVMFEDKVKRAFARLDNVFLGARGREGVGERELAKRRRRFTNDATAERTLVGFPRLFTEHHFPVAILFTVCNFPFLKEYRKGIIQIELLGRPT